MNKKIKRFPKILLFSGGLDSYIAWHYLNKPPVLFMKAGQEYEKKEFAAVSSLAKFDPSMNLIIDRSLDLSKWEEESHFIPYRNVFFTMIGSLYAPTVYLIGIKGDSVNDNNPEATSKMGDFYNYFTDKKNTIITSPFYDMSKTQIVKWYLKNNFSVDRLLQTRSCYDKNTEGHCGKCGSCFRRWVAMENNEIVENYDSPPWLWGEAKNYIVKMKQGLYDPQRTKETLAALSKHIKI